MKTTILLTGIIAILISGCTTIQTSSVTTDFRNQKGIYVIAYTDNQTARSRMETQLVNDLTSRNMVAVRSEQDFPDITTVLPGEIITKANDQKLLAVLVINRVAADGSGNIIQNPKRISPMHPTLQEFYAYSKEIGRTQYEKNQEVFAEVNLFILDRGEAKLFWSGTTWSFQADNKGTAIKTISDTITSQLAKVRDQYQ